MNLSNLRNIIVEAEEMGPIIPMLKRWKPAAGYPGGPEGPPSYKYNPTIVDYDGPGGLTPGWHDPDGPGPKPPVRANPKPTEDYDEDGVIGDEDDQLYHPGQDPWVPTNTGEYEFMPYDPGDIHYPGPNHGEDLPSPANPGWGWWPF